MNSRLLLLPKYHRNSKNILRMTEDSDQPKQFSAEGTGLEALQCLSSKQTTSHGNQRFAVPTYKGTTDWRKGRENTETALHSQPSFARIRTNIHQTKGNPINQCPGKTRHPHIEETRPVSLIMLKKKNQLKLQPKTELEDAKL